MTTPLIIWGASGHALVVADIIRLRYEYEISGYLDDSNPKRKGEEFGGSKILGGREQLEIVRKKGINYLIFGFGDCRTKLQLSDLVKAEGFNLATAIHPSALVAADVVIGAGSVLAAGSIVNTGSRIGENVIINTGATVDHECIIGNSVHLSPGAHLGGEVKIDFGTWIGIGAIIKDKVKIGSESIIGAGAVVLEDIPSGVIAYGVPAKIVKKATLR